MGVASVVDGDLVVIESRFCCGFTPGVPYVDMVLDADRYGYGSSMLRLHAVLRYIPPLAMF